MTTLLLDSAAWDLVLDASGNIAVATAPYALAQDSASAIKTFQGEEYFDVTQGVPYQTQIFGVTPPPLSNIKQLLINAALSVPGVASAQVFISGIVGRLLTGQVQIVASAPSPATVAAINFSVTNPQGVG